MASAKKQALQLARQLFKLSIVDGALSAQQVSGVLQYIERHRPANMLTVLKFYRRFVTAEVARGQAVVEHAGPIADTLLASIAQGMTQKYRRSVTSIARRNDALLAGLRVRVGDDVYESSVSGQLASLAAAV